jgi:hypothetical protein
MNVQSRNERLHFLYEIVAASGKSSRLNTRQIHPAQLVVSLDHPAQPLYNRLKRRRLIIYIIF